VSVTGFLLWPGDAGRGREAGGGAGARVARVGPPGAGSQVN
jgi:hypothetical protein